MEITEIILFILLSCECIYCAVSDIRSGIISNKVLLFFIIAGALVDGYYYSKIVPDLFSIFISNALVTSVLSILLFLLHIWAGGDTKMLITASILYPARYCLVYDNIKTTFEMVIPFSFSFGFLFLIVSSVAEFIREKKKINLRSFFVSLQQFMKKYFSMIVYIIFINMVFQRFIPYEFPYRSIVLMAVCFCIPWLVNRFPFVLHKKWIIAVFLIDVLLAYLWRSFGLIWNPESFIIVLISASLQILLSEFSYKTIPTAEISKGMILSLTSSMILQVSKIGGLPGLSHEDLSSRLTEGEASAIQKWGNSPKGRNEIIIVRKIPFAIFIALGIAFYLIIWISIV